MTPQAQTQHVFLAETPKGRHSDRHREAHKAGARSEGKSTKETRRISTGAYCVERPAQKQSIEDQAALRRRRDVAPLRMWGQGACSEVSAPRPENTRPPVISTEAEMVGFPAPSRTGYEPHFNHAMRLRRDRRVKRRSRACLASARRRSASQIKGMDQKHGVGRGRDAERRPDQKIAPLVLNKARAGRARVAGRRFRIGGEVGASARVLKM